MAQHSSVMLNSPCEFINITPFNPLISKCQIKVCYVSDEPNRNDTVLTKEVATEMAASLPGSPIVASFNEATGDFEEHNKALVIAGGKLTLHDSTRPYGFVDLGAKVWFQKFLDDGVTEREYLMTEGWLWTGQYPEAQRVIEQGNNQSMELNKKLLDGSWTKGIDGKPRFFIINKAIVEKLCILGEDFEPCFEGANITRPTIEFSYNEDFQNRLFSMMKDIKDLIEEGGTEMSTENIAIETPVVETPEEPVVETPVVEEPEANVEPETDFVTKKDEDEELCPECGKPVDECICEDEDEDEDEKNKKKNKNTKYSLDEVVEYQELLTQFSALQAEYDTLKESSEATIASLTEFKNTVEAEKKQEMINSFYMLSDEDKKDVIENINTYSLDEIEAKLSILCVRNKVNFNLDNDNAEPEEPTTYSLEGNSDEYVPAWIQSLRSVAQDIDD